MVLSCILTIIHPTDQQYNFVVGLETVLLGHEDWVYSVRWQPSTVTGMSWYVFLTPVCCGILCYHVSPSVLLCVSPFMLLCMSPVLLYMSPSVLLCVSPFVLLCMSPFVLLCVSLCFCVCHLLCYYASWFMY